MKSHPLSSSIVMVATVIVVVGTHNLAMGVFVGVLLSALFFANKISRFMVVKQTMTAEQMRTYKVTGQIFFASADKFVDAFDFQEVVDKVSIDLSHAHFWDISAVGALDKVVIKFRREGAVVELVGMNDATATVIDKFAVHNDPAAVEKMMTGH